ncbi:MAG TPA: hypothetical protein VHZ24_08540 [Pirellulales bacterium]|jgi:hypothetical protein|nr:hypothetical protein [Pirellulales bacterium]
MPAEEIVAAGSLRVRFTHAGDRYAHVVEVSDGDDWNAALVSIEGSGDEAWPASPPLQQLAVETRDGRPVAMLLGLAGASHWSVSIEAQSDGALSFDVACRVTQPPQHLSTVYHRPADAPDVVLAVDPAAGEASCVEYPLQELVRIDAHTQSVEPPATIRWRYTVSR